MSKTQRVTARDIEVGRIRVPIGDSKSAFPPNAQSIRLDLRGQAMESRWDPRVGPDQERSGVLGVDKAVLEELVHTDERLSIERDGDVIRLA